MEKRTDRILPPGLFIVMGCILFILGGIRFFSKGDWLGAVLFGAIGVGWFSIAYVAYRRMKEKE